MLVGQSAHDPTLVKEAWERGWDVDYPMCSLYYLTRPKPESRKLFSEVLPLGEIYLPSDPPAFANLKSTDAVIVGMYQQFGDQVGENAAIVREVDSRH